MSDQRIANMSLALGILGAFVYDSGSHMIGLLIGLISAIGAITVIYRQMHDDY